MVRTLLAAVGLLIALAGGTGVAVLLAGPTLVASGPSPTFESVLVAGCAAVLLGGWLWLAVTTAWYALTVLRAHRRRTAVTGHRGCPRLVRVGVVALMGLGPSVLVLPARADPSGASPAATSDLTGLPLPDRVLDRRPHAPSDVIVVRAGDTLWGLARARLPRGASDAAIDAAWHRLYRANRTAIGDDPDLLVPGTVLHERRRG